MKYRNKKTEYRNIIFDSKGEANRYTELLLLERAGEIENIERQPKFRLMPKKIAPSSGKHIPALSYKADFKYWDKKKSKWIVEDYKSSITRKETSYRLRRNLLLRILPDGYEFTEEGN